MTAFSGSNDDSLMKSALVDLSLVVTGEISRKLVSAIFRLDQKNWRRLMLLTADLGANSPAEAIVFAIIDLLKINRMRKKGYLIVAEKGKDKQEVELRPLVEKR